MEESPGGQIHEGGIYQLRKESRLSSRSGSLGNYNQDERARPPFPLQKAVYCLHYCCSRGGQQDQARIPKPLEQTHNDSDSLHNNNRNSGLDTRNSPRLNLSDNNSSLAQSNRLAQLVSRFETRPQRTPAANQGVPTPSRLTIFCAIFRTRWGLCSCRPHSPDGNQYVPF